MKSQKRSTYTNRMKSRTDRFVALHVVHILFITLACSIALHLIVFCFPLPAQQSAPTQQEPEFSSVEERRLFSSIQEERAHILEEKKEIALRKKELKSIEEGVDKKLAEIDNKLNELRQVRKKIETLLREKAEVESQNILDLAKIYEKMDPQRAALAIMDLDPRLATQLLAGMKTKAAAKILNEIPQEKATELSKNFSLIQLE